MKEKAQENLQHELVTLEKFVKTYKNKTNIIKPMTFTVLVTNNCNLRCKHCYHKDGESKKNDLSVYEYEKISKSIGFFNSVYYGGGEPFIREDFAQIVNTFTNNSNIQWSSTTTNGQLQSEIYNQLEIIMQNENTKRFVINFSLDGFKEEHDYLRGKGSYDKCIETYEKVRELKRKYNNLSLAIVSTMNTVNEKIIPSFFEYIYERFHPDNISLLYIRQTPRGGNRIKRIDLNNYIKASQLLSDYTYKGKIGNSMSPTSYFNTAIYKMIIDTINNQKKAFECVAGKYSACIFPNGDVSLCEMMENKMLGNLRIYKYDFNELWCKTINERYQMCNNMPECSICTHETEGLLPSIYFEPNIKYLKRIISKVKEYE